MGTASYCCSPSATGAGALTVKSNCLGVTGDKAFGVAGVAGLALVGGAWSLNAACLGVKCDSGTTRFFPPGVKGEVVVSS